MARSRSLLREYIEALLIAVIFAFFARTYLFQAFKIPTGSMEENLLIGDHILVNKFVYAPRWLGVERHLMPQRDVRRGDVVVFKFPEDPSRDFIKRCVGLAGDTIEIIDKRLQINGREVDEEGYIFHQDSQIYPASVFLHDDFRQRDNFGPFEVPEGHLFFMGDNRDNSNDSRFWGPVPEAYVRGRALMVYWSFEGEGAAVGWPGLAGKARQLASVVADFPRRTRWDRSFRIVR